jgi:phosphotransferase system HPr-like phosphotransfer protein
MGIANYAVIEKGANWTILHDGQAEGDYASKEAAFESAVAAASLAVRQGHEVHVSVPGQEAGNQTALGVNDNE